ncbi:flavin-containing monooxygenase [Nocardia sp. CA-120079]|uniref:flavin-containing monooxygenase n=1 Tax=Nocardia sp. CA-120079 TaxID=3239974 RepID=UPI003D97B125
MIALLHPCYVHVDLAKCQTQCSMRSIFDMESTATSSVMTSEWGDMLSRALRVADLNVMRIVVNQLTGDESMLRMNTVKVPIRGGSRFIEQLAPEHHDKVRAAATALLSQGPIEDVRIPQPDELRRLMTILGGEPLDDIGFRFAREEFAIDDFPRDVEWEPSAAAAERLENFRVVVVGGGISGIATAVMLGRCGIQYEVIERQSDLGGTWTLNDYPEARVDVTSYLYQFKFEKRYPWTEYFASQDETRSYLRGVAAKYGVLPHVTFGAEVVEATWDEDTAEWILQISAAGEVTERRADVVISASGLFHLAKRPNIEGLEDFQGAMFHTTSWDHSTELAGKRIGLIGNGSSGTQLMPYLASVAGTLTAFQRTPSWITPMERYREKVQPEMQWLFDHVPFYWNWYVFSQYIATTRLEAAQTYDPEWQAAGGLISERNDALREAALTYMRTKLASRPDLIEKSTPTYAPLARRLVVDNGWYDALLQDNVSLETDPIDRVTAEGVLMADGTLHELDVLVLATGFEVGRYFAPIDYVGRDGATLNDLWAKDGARSYLGMAIPGLPNLFCTYGPNGQPRTGGSYYSWAEIWARYIVKAVIGLLESGASSIECRRDRYDEYNERMDAATAEIIWEGEGVGGYYVNEFGRSGVNMPWGFLEYFSWVIEPDFDDYIFA